MDKKIKPLTKFGIWMGIIFIMITVSFIKNKDELEIFNGNKTNEENVLEDDEEQSTYNDYEKMQNKLKENNYDYEFIINNENKYTYTGTRCNGLEKGFKESNGEVIKYIINYDKKAYKIVNDEYTEIDDLYNGFDGNNLNIDKIFNDLGNSLYELDMHENYSTYTYNLETYKTIITTDNKNITSIKVINDNISYDLKFSNIGNCAKIDFNI